MPKMIKANKELNVADEKVVEFLKLGYSQIDEDGKIVKVGEATDLKDIKAENDTLKAKLAEYQENAEKIEKVAELEAKLAEYEKANQELAAQLEEAKAKKSK